MSRYSLILILFFVRTGIASAQAPGIDSINNDTDSTITLFNDPAYKLTLHIFDPVSDDEDLNNAIISFTHSGKILFKDSLFCMYPKITCKDFNKDGIKDILILHVSSARSNVSHYLYLVDNEKHKLIFVKGFTKLLNPEINERTGIITSMRLYGDRQAFSFYKITSTGKLIKTGHDYEEKLK